MTDALLMPQSIRDIVNELKANRGVPSPIPLGKDVAPPMAFSCSFAPNGANNKDLQISDLTLPPDLLEFWSLTAWARLYEDVTYGQWGLSMFSPSDAEKKTAQFRGSRARDFLSGDLIVGEFLGDSDLLLLRCDISAKDFGTVFLVAPIDPRDQWDFLGTSLRDFLHAYIAADGQKYWENR